MTVQIYIIKVIHVNYFEIITSKGSFGYTKIKLKTVRRL